MELFVGWRHIDAFISWKSSHIKAIVVVLRVHHSYMIMPLHKMCETRLTPKRRAASDPSTLHRPLFSR